jgi:predicted dehydrogenase
MTSAGQALRWGVMGTGGIAAAFATDLALLPRAEIVAVGSRTSGSAAAFADKHAIERRHGSYRELAADPAVDAVYVATPHPFHHECAMLSIEAGKPTLVEKPFMLDAAQARSAIVAARQRQVFLMEAMWTRFLPHVVRVRELIAEGRLGRLQSLQADFCERFTPDPRHRAYAPELGGGALLDLGVYPVSFASMLFGRPTRVVALSQPAFTGVDAQTAVVLQHDGGELAVLLTAIAHRTGNTATIAGTAARIEIEGDFLAPSRFRLIGPDGVLETHDEPHRGRGLRHQAAEVASCLDASRVESLVMPLDETLAVMETLDEIRRQIRLVYPAEAHRAMVPAETAVLP